MRNWIRLSSFLTFAVVAGVALPSNEAVAGMNGKDKVSEEVAKQLMKKLGLKNRKQLSDDVADYIGGEKGCINAFKETLADQAGPVVEAAAGSLVDTVWETTLKPLTEKVIKGEPTGGILAESVFKKVKDNYNETLMNNIAGKLVEGSLDRIGLDERSFEKKKKLYLGKVQGFAENQLGLKDGDLDFATKDIEKKLTKMYKKAVEKAQDIVKDRLVKISEKLWDKLKPKTTEFTNAMKAKLTPPKPAAQEPPKPAPKAEPAAQEQPKPAPKPEPAVQEQPKGPTFLWSYSDEKIQIGLTETKNVVFGTDTSKVYMSGPGQLVLKPRGVAPIVINGCRWAVRPDPADGKKWLEIRPDGACTAAVDFGFVKGTMTRLDRIDPPMYGGTHIALNYLVIDKPVVTLGGTPISGVATFQGNMTFSNAPGVAGCMNLSYPLMKGDEVKSPKGLKGFNPTFVMDGSNVELRLSGTVKWARADACSLTKVLGDP